MRSQCLRFSFSLVWDSFEFSHNDIGTSLMLLNFYTRPDSIIFRYSHRFDPFQVLAGKVFLYLHGFYLFPVLTRFLPFFGSHIDSTILRYSLGQFFDTRTDSTFSRYSTRILLFFGSHTDSTLFRYSSG